MFASGGTSAQTIAFCSSPKVSRATIRHTYITYRGRARIAPTSLQTIQHGRLDFDSFQYTFPNIPDPPQLNFGLLLVFKFKKYHQPTLLTRRMTRGERTRPCPVLKRLSFRDSSTTTIRGLSASKRARHQLLHYTVSRLATNQFPPTL